jgi:hypothetical protein
VQSLEAPSIPSMLGSLLEPELLAELLEILLHEKDDEQRLVLEMMAVLPTCERFETAWMFLEREEKHSES